MRYNVMRPPSSALPDTLGYDNRPSIYGLPIETGVTRLALCLEVVDGQCAFALPASIHKSTGYHVANPLGILYF
jgi:hypothetical protein